jgi:hypothetical protein
MKNNPFSITALAVSAILALPSASANGLGSIYAPPTTTYVPPPLPRPPVPPPPSLVALSCTAFCIDAACGGGGRGASGPPVLVTPLVGASHYEVPLEPSSTRASGGALASAIDPNDGLRDVRYAYSLNLTKLVLPYSLASGQATQWTMVVLRNERGQAVESATYYLGIAGLQVVSKQALLDAQIASLPANWRLDLYAGAGSAVNVGMSLNAFIEKHATCALPVKAAQ